MDRARQDRREGIPLEKGVLHLLEECRMVLPGIQMTFGFQLIVVFNDSFQHLLKPGEQRLHLIAITAVALAAALVMSPAAFHRQTDPLEVSDRLVRLISRLLMASMLPLAFGLCLDLYLLATLVLHDSLNTAYAGCLFLVFITLWYLLPMATRMTWRSQRKAP
jgi:hypothetical protein